MLEPGDELRLGLEPADELGVVGELGPDHLDRHLPADRRLVGAVDDAEATAACPFAQLEATDGSGKARQCRRNPVGTQRGKLAVDPGRHELEDRLAAGEASDAVLPERLHLPPGTARCRQRVVGVVGQKDLATVGGRQQAGAAVDRRTEIVAVAQLDLTGVDSDADT